MDRSILQGGTVIRAVRITNNLPVNVDAEITVVGDGILSVILRHAEERKGGIIIARKGDQQCLS